MQHNVLVTGAASPMGEHLIDRLLRDSRIGQVIAVHDPKLSMTLPEGERIKHVALDLRRQRALHDLFFGAAKRLKIDVVVHTSQELKATRGGAKVRALNVESLRSILDFAERHQTIKRLIIRSCVEVYQVQRDLPALIAEHHPLNMSSGAPQWVRDRVEADVTACTRMGISPLEIVVLRMAEILAPGTGSQMFDYLQDPICFRPVGFDPMLNFLTITDAAIAFHKAIHVSRQGVFNIPGADTLPLSAAIESWGRLGIPTPERGIATYYRLRRRLMGGQFSYGMNRRRFHFSGVLDGSRATDVLRYVPSHPIRWPTE